MRANVCITFKYYSHIYILSMVHDRLCALVVLATILMFNYQQGIYEVKYL